MEKIDNTTKFKIMLVIFLTNISMYMLASSTPPTTPDISNDIEVREGYTDFKIKANLLTTFEYNKPVTILGKNKTIYVPYAVLKEKVGGPTDGLSLTADTSQAEYIIYLPEVHIPKLLGKNTINILPFGKRYNVKKKKGYRYEINI